MIAQGNQVGSQEEWDVELSWRRIYCALNETLTEAVLKRILVGFLRELRRDDLLSELRCRRDLYYVLAQTVRLVEDAEALWADYVRAVHPYAPEGFDAIGRMGNEKKNRQSEAPERRLWVKGIRRHPDDTSSDYGRI